MIKLNSGFFKPTAILVSSFFGGIFLIITIGFIINAESIPIRDLLFGFVLFACLSFIVLLPAYMISRSKKCYLLVEDNSIVTYEHNTLTHKIDIKDISRITYYRITSVKSWFMIFNMILPQCSCITYKGDIEKEIVIGYPKFTSIAQICTEHNIEFVIE